MFAFVGAIGVPEIIILLFCCGGVPTVTAILVFVLIRMNRQPLPPRQSHQDWEREGES